MHLHSIADIRMKSIVTIILCLLHVTSAFPTGAPAGKCLDGIPLHGANPQTSAAPFTLTLSTSTYNPNDAITVTLASSDGGNIKGMVVRAIRTSNDQEQLLGTFSSIAAKTKVLDYSGTDNCWVHSEMVEETSVAATWTAPASSVGDVKFVATVVRSYSEFWTEVSSSTLTANVAAVDTGNADNTVSNVMATPDFSSCGDTKGCFEYPSGCGGNGCRFIASYAYNSTTETFDFEMKGEDYDYLALAFSDDAKMGDDEVIACVYSSSALMDIQHGMTIHATGAYDVKWYEILDVNGLTDMKIKKVGSTVYCSFSRPASVTSASSLGDVTYHLHNTSYSVFMARGATFAGTTTPNHHAELPIIGSSTDFTANGVTGGSTLEFLLIGHGVLGTLSYLFFTAAAVILMRYYKLSLVKPVCGKPLFFRLHQIWMWIATVQGIICCAIIMLHLGGWKSSGNAHGITGVLAVVGQISQIIAALIRPDPDAENRYIFNIVHRTVGILTGIVAVISIFLGFNHSTMDKELRKKESIVVGVWLIFIVVMSIILEILNMKAKKAGVEPQIGPPAPTKDGNDKDDDAKTTGSIQMEDTENTKPKPSPLFMPLFGVYMLVSVAFLLAAVIIMASS